MMRNYFIAVIISLFTITAYAAPLGLTVMPGTTLPNQFIFGGGADRAIYNVNNLTKGVRANNYVAHTPLNVAQMTSDSNVSSLCMPTFTLQPKGAVGSSCALELQIMGRVNGNDPNRFHHLFVCLSDKTTCVGPPDQINVGATDGIMVGEYETGEGSFPLLVMSNNSKPWRFVDVRTADGAPNFAPIVNTLFSVSCFENICLTGGAFSTEVGDLLPLLLVSRTTGLFWTFIDTGSVANTPQFGAVNQLFKVNCASSACFAGGYYQNSNQTMNLPFLLTTQNQGFSWIFIDVSKINNAPTLMPLGNVVYGGQCSSRACVTVGAFGTGNSSGGTSRSNMTTSPLLLTSNSVGVTWSFIDITQLAGVPAFGIDNPNELHAASCSDNSCVAVGNYTTADNLFIQPLILTSDKQGQNWAFINSANITGRPAGTFVGENKLNNVSCSNNACVAVGYYSVPSTGSILPLLIVSNNNGVSWRFINTTALAGVPTMGAFNVLYAASCSGNICSASGNYSTNSLTPDVLPLLFQSKDGGRTWAYIDTTVSNQAPTYGSYNNFFSTICYGNNVSAVVGNFLASDTLPLTLLTNAANNTLLGAAWSNLPTANISNFPAITSGTFNDIAATS